MVSTFAFDAAPLSGLDDTNNYYLQAVVSTPPITAATRADIANLFISTPQLLTGASYAGKVLTFADQVFHTRTYFAIHTGFVISRRMGNSISLSDPLIAYTPHTNNLGQEITKPVGTYAISLDFSSAGLFAVADAWQYDIGAWTNLEPFPKGAIYAIGSANNTTVFSNPHGNKITVYSRDNVNNLGQPTATFTGRNYNSGNVSGAWQMFGFNFQDLRIKLGTVGLHNYQVDSGREIKIYGSNNSALVSNYYYGSNWQNPAFYDLLFSTVNPNFISASGGGWYLADCNSSVKYQFITIETRDSSYQGAIDEIEFYNCSIYSLTENIV